MADSYDHPPDQRGDGVNGRILSVLRNNSDLTSVRSIEELERKTSRGTRTRMDDTGSRTPGRAESGLGRRADPEPQTQGSVTTHGQRTEDRGTSGRGGGRGDAAEPGRAGRRPPR